MNHYGSSTPHALADSAESTIGRQALSQITNARLLEREGLWDVQVHGRHFGAITPAIGKVDELGCMPRIGTLDAKGMALIPGLADAHVHFDKAYQLSLSDGAGGLAEAMAATHRMRQKSTLGALIPGMRRLVHSMRVSGTALARVQVEIDVDIDPATVQLHRDLAAEASDIRMQLVAFPQRGTEFDRSMRTRMEQALEDGCTVVGGCPYADPYPEEHIDFIFGLARDRGLPVDLHADLTDHANEAQIDLILRKVDQFGLQGRVALGHMTALSAMSPTRLLAVARELAHLGVSVISLPATDLWLSGREQDHDRVRGVAPLELLIEQGVAVALGSNNHQNAFTPVGTGSLLRQAWLAVLVCHMGGNVNATRLLTAITSVPALLMGESHWGVSVGAPATAALVDARDPLDAVRDAPGVLARIVSGDLMAV